MLFGVLDILLATPGGQGDNYGRNVTAIEMHILRELFDLMAGVLAEAWKPFYPAPFRQIPVSDEGCELLVTAAGPDMALVLNATAELNGLSAGFRLILPTCLARMAQLKSEAESTAAANRGAADGALFERTRERLGDAKVDLEIVLGGAGIRIRDLRELKPGSVLALGIPTNAAFDCLINGTHQFTGSMLSRDGQWGIQLDEPGAESAGA
jgi:flagellar motor switch protein FliM